MGMEPLPSSERQQLLQQAQQCGERLLRTVKMAQVGDKLGSKVFHGNATTRISYVRRATIFGSLRQVSDLYIHRCNPQLIDTAETHVVHVVQPPTEEHPMQAVNLRWAMLRSPRPKLVSHRDWLFLESMMPFEDESGVKGWLRCTHSIEHRDCPDKKDSHGYIRAEMHFCGAVFRETSVPNELDAVFYFDVDSKGTLPAMFAELLSKGRSRQCVPRVNAQLKAERTFSHDKQYRIRQFFALYPEEQKRKCRGCLRKLTMWNSRKKCSTCQAIVCRSCATVLCDRQITEKTGSTSTCSFCTDTKSVLTLPSQSSFDDTLRCSRMASTSISSTCSFGQRVAPYDVCSSMEIDNYMTTSQYRPRELSAASDTGSVRCGTTTSTSPSASASTSASGEVLLLPPQPASNPSIRVTKQLSKRASLPAIAVGHHHPKRSSPGPIFMNEDPEAPLCDLSYLASFK